METGEELPIDQLGEGVPNVVALLVDLAVSKDKLFLIEEPENDLHPKALKALMDLIILSSKANQFIISTHSNIVLRYLGAEPNAKIYEIRPMDRRQPPEATVHLVEATPEARLKVLRDLGYSFSDFDLWDGWLILEESSAERIIRDYLIPWFVPKLTRIRTLAASGADDVEPRFVDFDRLTRFTHLEGAYKGAAWVRLDGDPKGSAIVDKLRVDYKDWPEDRFACYSSDQFEIYFPAEFQERIEVLIKKPSGKHKSDEKKSLLKNVLAWLDEDEERGKKALEISAAEIIEDLQKIEAQLLKKKQ